MNPHKESPPASEFRPFTLRDWESRASVRASKHSYLLPANLQQQLKSRYWFPPAFLPYLNHPIIKNGDRSIAIRLSANHLVYFLDYTTLLEHRIVNQSVETIVHNELGLTIPSEMKIAALQLYTDEGYHALFSTQLADQAAEFYGIGDRKILPRKIVKLRDWIEKTPKKHTKLAWFLVGFVSETIIAKELLNLCHGELVSSVQEMLRDHLNDEARHSRYFCEVFHYLWCRLSLDQQKFTTRSLLEILFIFFEVDEPWLTQSLRSVGLGEKHVTQILCDQSDPKTCLYRTRSGAHATLAALTKAGFFNLPLSRNLFIKAGLLDV